MQRNTSRTIILLAAAIALFASTLPLGGQERQSDTNETLLTAAKEGNLAQVQSALAAGAEINEAGQR